MLTNRARRWRPGLALLLGATAVAAWAETTTDEPRGLTGLAALRVLQNDQPSTGRPPRRNLSDLLYARGPRPSPRLRQGDDAWTVAAPAAGPALGAEPTAPAVVPWNSARGRAAQAELCAAGDGVVTDEAPPRSAVPWLGGFIRAEPHVGLPGVGGGSYRLQDQLAGATTRYRQPSEAFGAADPNTTEQRCRRFAASVQAAMPMFVPFREPGVGVVSGWLSGTSAVHGSLDYARIAPAEGDDPAFGVHAVADGRVVAAYWDGWAGNTVVIEHTAPDGSRYRTVYMHLRDGYTHDLEQARALQIPAGEATDEEGRPTYWLRYQRFAARPHPSPRYWGTDDQRLRVQVGDRVTAGQLLGWSGNTGAAGAGLGLQPDGAPYDPVTANTHLHFLLAVPHPGGRADEWVAVDPYGAYADATSGAYQGLQDAPFVRLFAPFQPTFCNLPLEVLTRYFGYYPAMGYALQTLSLHRAGDRVLISGAFEPGPAEPWRARFDLRADELQRWREACAADGYRPRSLAATTDADGRPRFALICSRRAGAPEVFAPALTEAEWRQQQQELVERQHYRLADHCEYAVAGSPRHAAIFVRDGASSLALNDLDAATFEARSGELWQQGYRPVSINVSERPDGPRYGAVWRQEPGNWVAWYGMSPELYQETSDQLSAAGYRLWRVQGYADSGRFAAVWRK